MTDTTRHGLGCIPDDPDHRDLAVAIQLISALTARSIPT